MADSLNNLGHWPSFATLSIGSLPYTDLSQALDELALLDIPAAPQLTRLNLREDMIFGAVDGLPFIEANLEERKVTVPQKNLADNLAHFYELYFAGDFSFAALSPEASTGLEAFFKKAEGQPSFGANFLKAQVVGPLTFAQSARLENGSSAVDQPDILEALSLGLGAKAAYLASRIRALGRQPVVFIDEPGLTGYGSAFSTLSAETVLKSLSQAIETAKSQGQVFIGCHVCGNTDWGLLSQAPLDILNFDAYSYLETFCLYPKELKAFLERGGYLAFGLVPTDKFTPDLTSRFLLDKFWLELKPLTRVIDRELLIERSLLTSSCGLGSLPPRTASLIMTLLAQTAQLARQSV
ncbi:MAG: hypothetical protein LBT38_12600 [Deltaproteobacteria bacterium]|jgi:hypothetical protein|nr:hypothetical protein [Deltaproteobacteria bacterium]